jgi:uncharacterized protein
MSNDSERQSPTPTNGTDELYWGMRERTYAMVLHLSQFLGFVAPFIGLIAPVVMWVMYKDKNTFIRDHGCNVVNWILSTIIYAIICIPLCLVLIGFVALGVLFICSVVFTIIGAVKANNGELWKYPLCIRFFS